MIISYKWMNEYIDLDMAPEAVAQSLTMSGTEVEDLVHLGRDIEGVVTGRIESINNHPESEKLYVCSVYLGGIREAGCGGATGEGTGVGGTTDRLQVVTAATNLRTGDVVPVAVPGAQLLGGKVIGETAFLGVLSQGMLISAQELGLEKESTGILVMPDDTPVGVDIRPLVGLDDWTMELKVTPNRPDCLCMTGIARELAAITGKQLKMPEVAVVESEEPVEGFAAVQVLDVELCPRYTARVITGVKIAPSPEWMQQRLRAVGIRPINNVVDVTNYVMLELNQPLHAFDLRALAGRRIVVRRASQGEVMATLDGVERTLTSRMLLICDAERPVALAGVMGGANSEVTDDTVDILLESANFERVSVWRTSKDVKLRTEASSRFEKGLDVETAGYAADRAAQLIADLGSGVVAKGRLDVCAQQPGRQRLVVRPDRINAMLGTDISPDRMSSILVSLGFEVESPLATLPESTQLVVNVPTFRRDVTREADIAEEIGRIHGFDNIEATLPKGTATLGRLSREMTLEAKCVEYLVSCGFFEALTYAFTSPKVLDRIGIPDESGLRHQIALQNPLTDEFSVMRVSLLGSLLEAAERNAARRTSDLALFESARIYMPGDPMPDEKRVVAGIAMGRIGESGWNRAGYDVDFYDVSGLLQGLLVQLGLDGIDVSPTAEPSYHPGRCAALTVSGARVGVFGEIHPEVALEFGLPKRAYAFELDLDRILALAGKAPRYCPIPKFPAVKRDLAILVPVDTLAALVDGVIRREAGSLLESISLFDVYTGEQVPEGMRSMAYAISYRAGDRTLTDSDVNEVQSRVEESLASELGANIRG